MERISKYFFLLILSLLTFLETMASEPFKWNVKQVAAGTNYTMILLSDGSLWACGRNIESQLGDGTTTNRSTPVKVMTDVAAVYPGNTHTMIIKTDGTLWACGWNSYGKLGDGTTTNRTTPVQVMTNVGTVSAGYWHTMITKTNGSLWACGRNVHGQLGDGTTTDRYTPVQVMTGVAAVSAGHNHTMMLKTDGSLWACGYNSDGQLGDGTTTDRLTPVLISESDGSSDTDPTDISQYDNIVYLEPASVLCGNSITLPVKMKNAEANISGFQFDLVLPQGVTLAKDEDEFYLVELSTDRTTTRKHTVSSQLQADGSIRVVCYSNNNSTFSGTEGNVLTITLQVAEGMEAGDYALKLRNVVMTTPNLDSYNVPLVVSKLTVEDYILGDVNSDRTVNVVDVAGVVNLILNSGNTEQLNRKAADINGDGTINVVDVAGVVNIILGTTSATRVKAQAPLQANGQPLLYFDACTVNQGENITLPFYLDNGGDSFTGCQFDLYLPEGVTVEEEDGFPLVDIGSGTTARKHTVSTLVQPDGSMRVVCYSNNNAVFSGSEILTIELKAAEDAPTGSATVAMRNITLSRPDVTGVTLDDYEEELTIEGTATDIRRIAVYGTQPAPVYSLTGLRLSAPQKGVNIVGGRKLVVK
jgi:hypothetical protein